jgi:2-succinyl-5-enolpyruvyl-6-hydroxy-3-cyclohexene-1-carboxylate synthase
MSSAADHQYIYDLAELSFRQGIKDVVICPGSRSAPLVLGFSNHSNLRKFVIQDERSAGFIALGLAQATAKPVILICTSGTAGLNFGPAIAEAFFQGIPLIVCTADRPPEWVGQQDGQTIFQKHMYGEHVKGYFDVQTDGTESPFWIANRMMNEAILLSKEGIAGPVHLNFPFKEPLYPIAEKKITFGNPRVILEQAISVIPQQKFLETLRVRLSAFRRVILIAGQSGFDSSLSATIKTILKNQELVCLSEITGNLGAGLSAIRHADAILQAASDNLKKDLQPDLIISWGNGLISKAIKTFIRSAKPKEHWHIQEYGKVADTFMSLTHIIRITPVHFLEAVKNSSVSKPVLDKRKIFRALWTEQEKKVVKILGNNLQSGCEADFVRQLLGNIPDGYGLHLANSLSVRYANLFSINKSAKAVQVFSNRGTSGIDGCTSTAVGHQMAGTRDNVLLTGDVAFFYDRNAFWHNYSLKGFRVVVLNNQGGRIFGVIDGPKKRKEVSEYFIGKQNMQASYVADEFGFKYYRCAAGENYTGAIKDFFSKSEKPKLLEFISNPVLDKSEYEAFLNELKKHYDTTI